VPALKLSGQRAGTGDGFAVTLKARMVSAQARSVIAILLCDEWLSPLHISTITGYSYNDTAELLRAMVQCGWVRSRLEPDVVGVWEMFRIAPHGQRLARMWPRAAS
jgi:hypothetical protein